MTETTRLHDEILTLRADLAKLRDLLRTENKRANDAITRETTTEEAEEEQRLALSQALGLGTGAPWDAIRDRATELGSVLPAPAVPVSDDLLAAQLAPLEAAARDGREQQHAQHRAEVLREAAAHLKTLDPVDAALAGQHAWADAAAELRRMADAASGPGRVAGETQQPETQARRGDAIEGWLKAQRDEYHSTVSPQWLALDDVLDTYRLHADTGTPLGGHVCEGRTVGDCDCLEPHLTPSGNVRIDHLLRAEQSAAVSQPETEA